MDPTTVWRGVAVNEVSGQEREVELSCYEWDAGAKNNKAACSGECKHTVRLDGACNMGWPSKAVAAGKVPRRKGPTHGGDIKTGAVFIKGEGWCVAEYGFDNMNGPGRMHFGITGTCYGSQTCRSGDERAAGCIHDIIEKAHPNLIPLIRWHLAGEDSPSMHYPANAAYFYELYLGIGEYQKPEDTPEKSLASFKSTAVFGALWDDETTFMVAEGQTVDLTAENTVLSNRRHDLAEAQGKVAQAEAALKAAREAVYECQRAVKTVEGEIRHKRSAPILAWLEGRRERLMGEFVKTMQAFKLWEV